MKARTILQILSLVACAALVVAPALAGDDEAPGGGNGVCTTDGAWFGVSPYWGLTWTIVYQSDSHWTGSFSLRFIGGDPTLGGFFPDAVSLSETVGTWERTGRRTFTYTMIHWGLAEGGQQPVFILKNSGTSVVTGDCDQLEITSDFLAFYDPTQDPLGEDPPAFGCFPDGSVSTARRIPVEPACGP
jgi:hypothetical protein